MNHRMTSAVSPLVAFRLYDALDVLPHLATEGATDPPRRGPRHSLPTRQLPTPLDALDALDAQPRPLAVAAPPPERTSAPAGTGKDAPPCALSHRCQGISRPGKPESAPLATLDLDHTTAPRATTTSGPNAALLSHLVASAARGARAPREIAMALAGLALEDGAPPG